MNLTKSLSSINLKYLNVSFCTAIRYDTIRYTRVLITWHCVGLAWLGFHTHSSHIAWHFCYSCQFFKWALLHGLLKQQTSLMHLCTRMETVAWIIVDWIGVLNTQLSMNWGMPCANGKLAENSFIQLFPLLQIKMKDLMILAQIRPFECKFSSDEITSNLFII